MEFGQRAYQFYVNKGYSPVQAAALAGNAMAESRGSTTVTGDAGKALGLFQWHPDRQANLNRFATSQGLDPRSEQTQLAFKDWELRNTEAGAGRKLFAAQTPEEANAAVLSSLRPSGYTSQDPTKSHNWSGRLENTYSFLGSTPQQQSQAVFGQPEKVTVDQSATPVYSQDFGTGIRRTGNFFLPSLVDAPTPLTPEQAATQKAELTQQAAELKGIQDLGSVTKGFLSMMQMGQQQPQEEEMLKNQIRGGQFTPLPLYRGLL
jgi:hypothetical protein